MKKENILGWIVYLLLVAFGIVFLGSIMRNHQGPSLLGDFYVLYNIGAILAGFVINAFLFEIAHVLGALAGGYNIIKVSVLGLTLKKDNKKWKFCFSDYDGLSGETKIVPKEGRKKQSNPYPYLLFGTLFMVAEVVVVMIFFSMYKGVLGKTGNIVYFFFIACVIGLMMFVYNILPLQLDSMTDGYRLTKVTNPKNREAFNELLKAEYDMSQGNTGEIKVFTEITNYTADLNLTKVYALFEEKKFDEAESILDGIINAKGNVSKQVYIRAKAQKVYIHLMNNDLEAAKEYYENDVPVSERREIADDGSMPCIRAYILMSGLLDKSRSECAIAINRVGTAFKRTPEKRKAVEKELYNESLKKVNEAHPKWELDKYLME